MTDRTIVCRVCGQGFTFTADEQAFYQERGFNEPQRCADCRAAYKAQRASSSVDDRSVGSSSRGFGGGYGGSRQLFPAVCSACGKETEVPFQPRTDKPVYCRECFRERGGAAARSGYARA